MVSTHNNDSQPLTDLKVIDLTQVISGSFATMMLADMGAEVIKIEAVGRGDVCRSFEPSPNYFDVLNRNKRSLELNLKSEDGRRIALRLLKDADVFVENAKPGAIEQFGLTYEEVQDVNPEIIYCSISGFGSDSPYEDLPSWDMLVQGMSGMMGMTGQEGGPPIWSGLPIGDLAASLYAGYSVMTALYARDAGRIETEYIQVPMLDSLISLLTTRAGYSFATGEPFPRLGTYHPALAPFGVYDTSDGQIIVAAGTDGLWPSFCEALGRPELADRDEFATLEARLENREKLRETLEAELEQRTTDKWLDRMHAESAPVGRINDTLTVWDDEHVKQRQLHRTMQREGTVDADVIDSPVRFRNLDTELVLPPPTLGQHTDEVLAAHGFDEEEIASFRDDDVIG
jgi:crotonobetainyl-CoA:carnitine CoA-transferase CaiB-like acyl-CoA transferase